MKIMTQDEEIAHTWHTQLGRQSEQEQTNTPTHAGGTLDRQLPKITWEEIDLIHSHFTVQSVDFTGFQENSFSI